MRNVLSEWLKIFGLCIVFLIMLIVSLHETHSVQDNRAVNLSTGNNLAFINSSQTMNVSDFIRLNPDIETVSYRKGNLTIGYVNVFGGIGKNFQIKGDIEYSIFSSRNITLNLQ